MSEARTLFDKIWESHVVVREPGMPDALYIDLQLIHEVTSPQAFDELRKRNLPVWDPNRIKGTVDHCNPTRLGPDGDERSALIYADENSRKQILKLEKNCKEFGIECFGLDNSARGVVHVFAPDLGLTQPGMTIVCGDSHTATHGAFGSIAFGIGTSEVSHVMGTQCLFQSKPKSMLIRYIGELPHGTGAKDLILYTIAKIGVSGGTNYAIEYSGDAVRSLSMEGRMTICNMTIEAGARFGIVAPDETTFAWLKNKKFAPKGEVWDKAVAAWRNLYSDEGAVFDKVIEIDVSKLEPMVTYGTTPETAIGISDIIPDSEMLNYSGLKAGNPIAGTEIDYVFIGSCTNGRLADLREAAEILRGKKVADGVQMIVVPGSGTVKRQAEAEGLDKVFLKAGAEWREPGCSLCLSMNGDFIEAGKRCISTSNRNFEGRQGPGSRTILASPATAAASAIKGVIIDPRQLGVHHA